MTNELDAIEANNTWSVVHLPANQYATGCMWISKVKYKSVGTLDIYKARWVSCMDTFSPVKVLLSIVVIKGLVHITIGCQQCLFK